MLQRIFLVVLIALSVQACGSKGALYMPTTPAPAPAPAPQSDQQPKSP
jgi:predicted small lipoprotein YifL